MGLLTERNLAVSAATDDLIHIVKTGDTSQSPFGSSYKATLGQVLALVPQSSGYTQVQDEGVDLTQRDTLNFVGSGVTASDSGGVTTVTIPGGALGGLIFVKSLSAFSFPSNPTTRILSNGTIFTNYDFGDNWGSLNSATTFNATTGVFTAPDSGYYDFNLLFKISITQNSNNLTGGTNQYGFVGNGVEPTSSILATPADLSDYFGKFVVGITNSGTTYICSNTYQVDYNTAEVLISASHTNRKVVAGAEYDVRFLNTCRNTIQGVAGNSVHFTITHIR